MTHCFSCFHTISYCKKVLYCFVFKTSTSDPKLF